MQALIPWIEAVRERMEDIYASHPVGSLIATTVTVSIPVLYYIYNQNLKHWTFNLHLWGSYEVAVSSFMPKLLFFHVPLQIYLQSRVAPKHATHL